MACDINPDRSRTGTTWDTGATWWRTNLKDRRCVQSSVGHDYYRGAYRHGWDKVAGRGTSAALRPTVPDRVRPVTDI